MLFVDVHKMDMPAIDTILQHPNQVSTKLTSLSQQYSHLVSIAHSDYIMVVVQQHEHVINTNTKSEEGHNLQAHRSIKSYKIQKPTNVPPYLSGSCVELYPKPSGHAQSCHGCERNGDDSGKGQSHTRMSSWQTSFSSQLSHHCVHQLKEI